MQVFIHYNEKCKACGAVNSFRKTRTMISGSVRRIYVKCKKCGAHGCRIWQNK